MKKAIVLGVGNAQVDLIRYLKEQGWYVIGCSYRREGRGLAYVDQFALVNITDTDGVERLARAEKADLIYSIGSDLAMPTVVRVASCLKLPSLLTAETADLLQSKLALRGFLNQHGISPIRYKGIRSQSDLDDWTLFPAMVKPVDNQGQRGVFLAASLEEARSGLERTLNFSRTRTAIIEEYLEGPEISVNTFVLNGETVFNEVSDRLVVEEYVGGLPRGHIYPPVHCTETARREAQLLTAACNRALGIKNGPIYYQAILTSAGIRIVEATPRLDGCHMWRLIKTVCGVDLLAASVQCLLGEAPPDLSVGSNLPCHALGFFYLPPNEKFSLACHPAPAAAVYCEYYYADDETVRPINGFWEKVGYYIEPYVQ